MSEVFVNDLKLYEERLELLPKSLKQALERVNKDRFTTLKDVNNRPYKPNAPSWIAVKGNSTPTIGITGNLRADLVVTAGNNVIRMISNMDYASHLQKEREFLGVSESELQEILNSLSE